MKEEEIEKLKYHHRSFLVHVYMAYTWNGTGRVHYGLNPTILFAPIQTYCSELVNVKENIVGSNFHLAISQNKINRETTFGVLGAISLNLLGGKTGILCTEKRAPKPLVKRPPEPSSLAYTKCMAA
jgi:hypothetical protein